MIVMPHASIDQGDEEMHPDLVEGPQPLEGAAQTATSTSTDSQQVEDPQTSRFKWRIEDFSTLNTKKLYFDIFVIGIYNWRILIFPKGNNVDHLSMYLDVADSTSLPYGWSR